MLSFGSGARGLPAALAISLLAIFAVGCAAAGSRPAGGADGPAAQPGSGPGVEPGDGAGRDVGNGNGGGAPLYQDVNRPDLLIIKTGTMTIQVTAIEAAVDAATQAIVGLGGYASASERSGEDEDAYASVTYRVPADRWDAALAAVRGLGERVLHERSGTEDVTSQVVDLAARIRNLQATELAFQEIMSRATEIKDVLAVQAELTKVRGEIEQLTAQKNRLEQQAALSTLSVTFSLKPDPILASQERFDPGTEVDQATASLVTILQAVATAGIWFAIVWLPILVVLSVMALIGLVVVRRVRRSAIVTPGA